MERGKGESFQQQRAGTLPLARKHPFFEEGPSMRGMDGKGPSGPRKGDRQVKGLTSEFHSTPPSEERNMLQNAEMLAHRQSCRIASMTGESRRGGWAGPMDKAEPAWIRPELRRGMAKAGGGGRGRGGGGKGGFEEPLVG